MNKQLRFVSLLVNLVVLGHGLGVSGQELISFTGPTMGTRYTITVAEGHDLVKLQKNVEARLAEINRLMSTYDPESELSQFNKYQGTDWFPVSADTVKVVQFALQVAKKTGGAFDPTVGPAVNLWGFGPEGRRKKPPSEVEVAAVLPRIGFENVEARSDPPALRKQRHDVYLDLSAVAKGFAVDEISDLVAQEGCADSLVVIGGDIRARGRKPDGAFWRIGIEEPDSDGKPVSRSVNLENVAVATSGDWNNSFVHDGVRYSHVIDPQTGKPVRHKLASVTVFADTNMRADAWDTGLLVMGDELGMAWCEERGVAAIFFIRQKNGTILSRASTHVAKRVIP
ncbi:MAG: FAD:protein FMN transferase [Bythopirellula sp.]|nr:FAD:protein FMN transferase [Bythopirellula sp.]